MNVPFSDLDAATTLSPTDGIAAYVFADSTFSVQSITFANFRTALDIPEVATTVNVLIGDGSGNATDSGKDAANIGTVGTGWGANGDTGDKTASIPDAASIASALSVFAGSYSEASQLLSTVAAEVKALKAAMMAREIPNQ